MRRAGGSIAPRRIGTFGAHDGTLRMPRRPHRFQVRTGSGGIRADHGYGGHIDSLCDVDTGGRYLRAYEQRRERFLTTRCCLSNASACTVRDRRDVGKPGYSLFLSQRWQSGKVQRGMPLRLCTRPKAHRQAGLFSLPRPEVATSVSAGLLFKSPLTSYKKSTPCHACGLCAPGAIEAITCKKEGRSHVNERGTL